MKSRSFGWWVTLGASVLGAALLGACSGGSDDPVSVTYLGNDGVFIQSGDTKIVVDALQVASSGFIPVPPDDLDRLERGVAPYDGIDAVLITHVHFDHFDPASVERFLQNNPDAVVLAPPQVRAMLPAFSQIHEVAPVAGQRASVDVGGVEIDILHTQHFNQFGLNFDDIENFAFLFELEGQTFLHAGDVRSTVDNLARFALPDENIDVAFLPTFAEQLSDDVASVVVEQIAPEQVVGLHLLAGVADQEAAAVMDLYEGGFAFTTPLDERVFDSGPS